MIAFTTLVRTACCLMALIALSERVSAETYKVGIPEALKPYTYKDGQEWVGIDMDIARELYRRMGLDVEFKSAPWARQLAYAERGLTAGILTVYCKDKKDFLAVPSESFYEVKISVFSRKTSTEKLSIQSLDDIPEGSVIGIVRGNFFAEEVEKYPHISINYTHNTPLLIQQLQLGRIDYVIEEYLPFMYYSKENGISDTFVENMVYLKDEVCTAFSRPFFGEQASELAIQASELIRSLKEEGFIQGMIKKYIQ